MLPAAAFHGLVASRLETLPTGAPFVREDAPRIALTHVCVIDGTGAAARADQTLLIEDGKIAAIGDAATTKFLTARKPWTSPPAPSVPACWQCDDHMYYPSSGRSLALYPEHASASRACTSPAASLPFAQLAASRRIRTLNSSQPSTRKNGRSQDSRHRTIAEGKGSFTPQMRHSQTPRTPGAPSNTEIAEGATSFKAYMNITPTARRRGQSRACSWTQGHRPPLLHRFREAAALGIDDLEHGLFVDNRIFSRQKPGQCPDDPSAAEKSLLDLDIAAVPVKT